jgi:hypothetical protein
VSDQAWDLANAKGWLRMNGDFRFSVVTGLHELTEVHTLRTLRYRPRFPDSEPWWLDRERDIAGKVFLIRGGDRALATLRIVPVTGCVTEMEELGHLPADLKRDPTVWELGRLAALRSRGEALSYARLLFDWATRWAQTNLSIERVVSYCKGGKLSGFQALGAEVTAGPYEIPGRGGDYHTIVAEVREVVTRMRAFGLSAALATAPAHPDEVHHAAR